MALLSCTADGNIGLLHDEVDTCGPAVLTLSAGHVEYPVED